MFGFLFGEVRFFALARVLIGEDLSSVARLGFRGRSVGFWWSCEFLRRFAAFLRFFEVSRSSDRLIVESIVAEEGVVHRSL